LAVEVTDLRWSLLDYLCVVLEREASARTTSGVEQRIRSAGFLARNSGDDFDFGAANLFNQLAS